MSGTIVTYTGIADCHGLESFNEKTEDHKSQSYLVIRANANPQRHAVVYEADMSKEAADLVMNLCKENEATAFKFMNQIATEVRVAGGKQAAKLWKRIPNPELDPFY